MRGPLGQEHRAGEQCGPSGRVACAIVYDSTKILQKLWVKNYYLTGLGFESARFTDVYVTRKR